MKKLLFIVGALLLLVGLTFLGAGAAHLGQAPGKLTWDTPKFRSALITFAYRVYGNPKMDDGQHFLSKVVFDFHHFGTTVEHLLVSLPPTFGLGELCARPLQVPIAEKV